MTVVVAGACVDVILGGGFEPQYNARVKSTPSRFIRNDRQLAGAWASITLRAASYAFGARPDRTLDTARISAQVNLVSKDFRTAEICVS